MFGSCFRTLKVILVSLFQIFFLWKQIYELGYNFIRTSFHGKLQISSRSLAIKGLSRDRWHRGVIWLMCLNFLSVIDLQLVSLDIVPSVGLIVTVIDPFRAILGSWAESLRFIYSKCMLAYLSVSVIHRTLTLATGSLTCIFDLNESVDTLWTKLVLRG